MTGAERLQILGVKLASVLFDVVNVEEPLTLVPLLLVLSEDAGVAVSVKYVEPEPPPGGRGVERRIHGASRRKRA